MRQLTSLLIILSLGSFVKPLLGQDNPDLPVLLPADIQAFTPQTNFSRLCISDLFYGKDGRIWLNTCGVEKSMYSLPLVQFDGYSYLPVNLANLKIPDGSYVSFLEVKSNKLHGYFLGGEKEAFFSYNLHSSEVELFDNRDHFLPGSIIRAGLSTGAQEWIFCVKSQDRLLFYRKNEEGTSLQLDIPYPFIEKLANLNAPRSVIQEGQHIWYIDHLAPLVRWNKITGEWKKYEKEDFAFDLQLNPEYQLKWWIIPKSEVLEHNGKMIVCMPAYNNAPFFKLNPQTDTFLPITGFPTDWQPHSMYKDQSGNLVYIFRDPNEQFKGILEDSTGMQYNFSSLLKGHKNINKLIGTNFKRQFSICTNAGIYTVTVRQSNSIRRYLPSADIRAMTELSNGQYLINTGNQGWKLLDKPSNIIDSFATIGCEGFLPTEIFRRKVITLDNNQILTYHNNHFVSYDLENNRCNFFLAGRVFNFTFLNQDTIAYWDEDQKALSFFDFEKKTVIPYLENGQPKRIEGYIQELVPSRDGQLWIVSSNGLWKIDYKNQRSQQFGFEPGFKDHRFLTMYEDEKGQVWLGSYIGGLHIFNPTTGKVSVLDQEQGLSNNTIVSILRDDEGIFWVGTYNGISLVSPEGKVLTNIRETEGLIGHEFNRYARLKGRDGALLLGTTAGLNVIDPTLLKEQLLGGEEVKIYLTELFFHDNNLDIKTRLWKPVDFKNTIILPAGQRYLRLKFALSSYIETDKNQYAYKLVSKDKKKATEWNYLGSQHELSLTNLPSGKYELWIKGSDYKGNWSIDPVRLSVHAHDFFYKQPSFYILIVTVLFIMAFFWIRHLRSEKIHLEEEVKRRTKQIIHDKEIIETQAKELKQLDELKSRFFTNISHELRTPITLITAPVEQLLQQSIKTQDNKLQNKLRLVLNNGKKLLRLIEELLNLSRLEANKIALNETPTSLVTFCSQLFSAFQSISETKQLDFQFQYQLDQKETYLIDRSNLEKIINNLLSNALKFTPPKGKILFSLTRQGENILIQVADNGRGIPPEDIPYVFDRYFQTKSQHTNTMGGLGVGLALSNEMARLMNAQLTVESELGKGSVFSLRFQAPRSEKEPTPVFSLEHETHSNMVYQTEAASILPLRSMPGRKDQTTIFMVEDNPDMQQLIQSVLGEQYHCHPANNGAEAWNWINTQQLKPDDIDLILSDVMMPEMDGYEFLNHIKKHPSWQNIPFVMLTARADEEDKLQALRFGVDDYILKPFSPLELQVRLANLIQNARARKVFLEKEKKVIFEFEELPSAEQSWLQKLETAAKEALDTKVDLSKAFLASQMSMSERQLLRRLKALTGLTIQKYILEVKLQKARHLLESKAYQTIAETSFACGFSSPGYFSQLFEKHYGKRPADY